MKVFTDVENRRSAFSASQASAELGSASTGVHVYPVHPPPPTPLMWSGEKKGKTQKALINTSWN